MLQKIANKLLLAVQKIDEAEISVRSPAFFKAAVLDAISKEDWNSAINLLMESMDAKQQISWHVADFIHENKHVLIRDARAALDFEPKIEPYLIMAINYVRAIKALLTAEGYVKIHDYLALLTAQFFEKVTSAGNDLTHILPIFSHFNTVLINNYVSCLSDDPETAITFDEAIKRLNIAKDFASLEQASKHIVTLSLQKNKDGNPVVIFQADMAQTALTDNIRREYRLYSKAGWFEELPDWQKQLMIKYIPLIMQENRVLPTQLRVIPLVGLRNFYLAINGLFDFIKNEAVVLSHAYHSGTIVALGPNKEINQAINLLHGEQLKQTTKADIVLTLTLNSDINPKGNDKTIVTETSRISHLVSGIVHANYPMNYFRKWNPVREQGLNELLNLVADRVIPSLIGLPSDAYADATTIKNSFFRWAISYLKSSMQPKLFTIKINDFNILKAEWLASPRVSKVTQSWIEALHLALLLRHRSLNNHGISDRDNRNLHIASLLNLLGHHLAVAGFKVEINSSCESGKDRDAILMISTALMSFMYALFDDYALSPDNALIQGNIIALAYAGHFQFLAGCQGGTPGAFGIKKDSKAAIPAKEFPKAASMALIQETASYNKKILVNAGDTPTAFYFPITIPSFYQQHLAICHTLTLWEKKLSKEFARGDKLASITDFFSKDKIIFKQLHVLNRLLRELKPLSEEKNNTSHIYDLLNRALSDYKRISKREGPTSQLLSLMMDNLAPLLEIEDTFQLIMPLLIETV